VTLIGAFWHVCTLLACCFNRAWANSRVATLAVLRPKKIGRISSWLAVLAFFGRFLKVVSPKNFSVGRF